MTSVSTSKGYINENNVKEVYLQILRGRDGRDGLPGSDGQKGERGDKGGKGEKGETGAVGAAGLKNGGVVYTRWGRKSCPNDTGAQLVYEGITGGSPWGRLGGGANYVCLPKDPQYISIHICLHIILSWLVVNMKTLMVYSQGSRIIMLLVQCVIHLLRQLN